MLDALTSILAVTTEEGWRPGIGDPTFMGWFTVAAYWAVAFLCHRAYRAAKCNASVNSTTRHSTASTAARLWLSLAVAFALLGINKQLDLQTLFTQVGRSIALNSGWYGERRTVQFIFILMLAALGMSAMIALLWATRRMFKEFGLAMIGTAFVLIFIIIRAASFHHFDRLLDVNILGFNMNWLFELSGIACVGIGAAVKLKQHPMPRSEYSQPSTIHRSY